MRIFDQVGVNVIPDTTSRMFKVIELETRFDHKKLVTVEVGGCDVKSGQVNHFGVSLCSCWQGLRYSTNLKWHRSIGSCSGGE